MKATFNQILQEVIKPKLFAIGFRKSGNTFRKIEKNFVIVFDIWKSSWNTSSEIMFWFEVGVYGDSYYKFMFNKNTPKSIRTNHCSVRLLGAELLRKQYMLTNSNSATLILEIKSNLDNNILPLLGKLKTIEDISILEDIDPIYCNMASLFIGLQLNEMGDKQKAQNYIEKYLRKASRYPDNWVERIENEAKRLKLKISPASS